MLGKKRFLENGNINNKIRDKIYGNKNSTPSMILLCKIVEEFSFNDVIDALLKSNLSSNNKLDSMLQGIIDSEGINKVILMLLKLNQYM